MLLTPPIEGVPLNLWPLTADDGPAVRAEIAARAVHTYSPAGGSVLDLSADAGGGLAAIADAGRHAIVLPPPCRRGRTTRRTRLGSGVDLVLALPTARRLRPLRPCTARLDKGTVTEAAEHLRAGGYLVIGVVPAPGRDAVTATVSAATEAGLDYFQHVIAVDTAVAIGSAAVRSTTGRRAAHVDVLVFARRSS